MTVWVEPISLDAIKTRSKHTMAEHLGIEFIQIGDDFLKATMPVDHRTQQPLGILNGGASCALAETVASTAANYCVDQKTAYCVGLDINANHLKAMKAGEVVTAVAKPFHLGRTTQGWQIEIFNSKQQLGCIARMTMAVVQR